MTTPQPHRPTATASFRGGITSGGVATSVIRALEQSRGADAVARLLRPLADGIVGTGARRELLEGRPLGHALHPALTDLPIGFGLAATALDVLGGQGARPSSCRLVGLGVLAGLPAAVTGLAEWRHTSGGDARTGSAHAALNAAALTTYAASWAARRSGRQRLGVTLGLAGGGLAGAGAWLGGHLAIARKVGSHDPAFDDRGPGRVGG